MAVTFKLSFKKEKVQKKVRICKVNLSLPKNRDQCCAYYSEKVIQQLLITPSKSDPLTVDYLIPKGI